MVKINYNDSFDTNKATTAEIFDEANKNFKKVKRTGIKKYWGLHYWTYNKSVHLIKEINKRSNNKVYKRGAIVFVDFGVNVGGEFSGPHFCIVLNKSDNSGNEKITVVPLTSHCHQHTVKLENTIMNESLKPLSKSLSEVADTVISQSILTRRAVNTISNQQVSFEKTRQQVIDSVSQPENVEIIDNKFNIISFEEAEQHIKQFINKKEQINIDDITSDQVSNYVIGVKSQEIPKDFEQFNEVYARYRNYNLTTYARVEDITTLSKRRIKRINQYDPIGKIKASTETLDTIDLSIKELFIGK